MHIVIVNDFAHVNGGAGQVALGTARGLAERGHHVTVLCAVAPVAALLDHQNINVVCTEQHELVSHPSLMRGMMQGLWNRKAQRTMETLLADLPRDDTVVHFHGWTKALSASVMRAAITRGFRTTSTLHEYFAACPNGGFYDYRKRTICTRKPLGMACLATNCDARSYAHKLWRVARQATQKHVARFPGAVDHFISISDVGVGALKSFLPAGATVTRIPNPTTVEPAEPVDVAANNALVFVGRLSVEKGAVLFAQAAHAEGIAPLFIGDGMEHEAILGACPAAQITGWLDGPTAKRTMRQARALVLPSLWYEGQPLVVGDAAALGIPAIVSDTCAAREVVEDGVTGLWFRGGDVDDLRRQLRRVLNEPTWAAQLGHAAYARYWAAPPTMEAHLDRLEAFYHGMLAQVSR